MAVEAAEAAAEPIAGVLEAAMILAVAQYAVLRIYLLDGAEEASAVPVG
jgi:hypothetical protein